MKTIDALFKTCNPEAATAPQAPVEPKVNDDLVNRIAEAVIAKLSQAQTDEPAATEDETPADTKDIIEEVIEDECGQSGEVG